MDWKESALEKGKNSNFLCVSKMWRIFPCESYLRVGIGAWISYTSFAFEERLNTGHVDGGRLRERFNLMLSQERKFLFHLDFFWRERDFDKRQIV